jgi:hypothetical protein
MDPPLRQSRPASADDMAFVALPLTLYRASRRFAASIRMPPFLIPSCGNAFHAPADQRTDDAAGRRASAAPAMAAPEAGDDETEARQGDRRANGRGSRGNRCTRWPHRYLRLRQQYQFGWAAPSLRKWRFRVSSLITRFTSSWP